MYLLSLLTFLRYSLYAFEGGRLIPDTTLASYREFFTDSYYFINVFNTFKLGIAVTLLSLLIGYPLAYGISKIEKHRVRLGVTVAVFTPLLVSVVIRSYGWMLLFGSRGAISYFLTCLGVVGGPLRLMNDFKGVVIASVHVLLPFMVFAILSSLVQVNPFLKEASSDLGANRWHTFLHVTFPLTTPGIVAGAKMVFPLAVSAFVTPALLGGGRVLVLSTAIYQYTVDLNWPMAAVGGMILLTITVGISLVLEGCLRKVLGGGGEPA